MRTVLIAIAVTGITIIGMYGADRSVGTWKFNTAKSKSTSTNPIKSRTEIIEETPDGGVKITRSEQRADGTSSNFSYSFKYGGKEYPVTGGTFDTVSAKRVDANTTNTEVRKKDGTLHQTAVIVISKDGKTRTTTVTGTDAQRKPIQATGAYEKQ